MKSIKETIMERDGLTEMEADQLIKEAKADFNESIACADLESAENICADWFGLESDYLFDLLD